MEGRELPVGWVAEGLASVVSLKTGPFGSSLHKSDYVNGATPVVNPMHIINGRIVPDAKTTVGTDILDRLKEFRLEVGDVVLGRRGEMGRAAVARMQEAGWLCGTGSLVLRQLGSLDPEFLQRFLSSPLVVMALEGASVGSTMVNLNQGILRTLEIPIPPLNEQRRIAAKLDTTLAAVDACRQRLDGVAAILKRFRQAVLAAATSGELTREWREERGSQWAPRVLTVGDLGTIVTGNTPKAVHEDTMAGVPLFKPTELDAGYEVRHAKELMGEKRALGARMLPTMSVLVTCIGTIGKTGLSRIPGATNQQINAIICHPKTATPQWTYFWFTSPIGKASIVDNASATTLPIINKSRFSALKVEIPGIEEQQEIVQLIESLFTLADQLEAKLTAARKLVDRLTPALLAKAFRGELVPQDPSDEPASVLLDRIRAARQADAAAGKPSRRGRRKAAASPELAPLTATPAPADLLAQLLHECGALSERALLAASELDPAGFRAQLALEQGMGAIRETAEDGQVLLEAVG